MLTVFGDGCHRVQEAKVLEVLDGPTDPVTKVPTFRYGFRHSCLRRPVLAF
jgi:hypothetical protein